MRRPGVQLGDLLQHNYLHYFTRAEIEAEMREAGFELEHYSTDGYAHAVGVAL